MKVLSIKLSHYTPVSLEFANRDLSNLGILAPNWMRWLYVLPTSSLKKCTGCVFFYNLHLDKLSLQCNMYKCWNENVHRSNSLNLKKMFNNNLCNEELHLILLIDSVPWHLTVYPYTFGQILVFTPCMNHLHTHLW